MRRNTRNDDNGNGTWGNPAGYHKDEEPNSQGEATTETDADDRDSAEDDQPDPNEKRDDRALPGY